ncbi:response regulator transcription factor [Paraburkholderia sp. MMS20-SJTR3]|uniref:Response regulator transcription factor n=1 Tax=Paraburkholderia sejongensis TaxID=2886946 RepID=A0ABS8JZU0_9BURK|nr:response regulator transcription factor [Paraburkholderia sp. MMS20-SJTR3]MCC8395410.1 response regulator transcription factor [Paraburkholderia sp. MMS20-SJTR3]
MQINVVLADDHPALVAGVKYALEPVRTIKVTGTAQNSSEIIQLLESVPCDVLVADYAMPNGAYGDGITLLSYLRRRYPDLKIIVFTMVDNPAIMREVARLGVHSYLNKTDDLDRLVSAIHAVYANAIYFPNESARPETNSRASASKPSDRIALSKREIEVIRLYVSGMAIGEIAKKLNRSKQTISSQKTTAMKKLGIVRDAELFRYAWEMGIDGTPPSASDDETAAANLAGGDDPDHAGNPDTPASTGDTGGPHKPGSGL